MIKRRIFAALFLLCAPAYAQNPGTVTNHAIPIGKGAGNTGFGNAAPGTTGIPLTSNGASSDPSFHSIGNAGIAAGSANTVKGSVDGATTSDLAVASCSAVYQFTQWVSGSGWQCGIIPVISSRAVAATLNLSAFSAVTTLGYATPGDGGGAYFSNASTTPFIDSQINGIAFQTLGTGCTNGTYHGQSPSGGTGSGATVVVTISGNVMTGASITGTGGNAYTVNDILTMTSITGCSVQPSVKVTSVTTPTCSFSDTGSNHWQLVVPDGQVLGVRQCGAKADWTTAKTDAGSTCDDGKIQNALSFAGYNYGGQPIGNGGVIGAIVHQPPSGISLICNQILLPGGVTWRGDGAWTSGIKISDTFNAANNVINICDTDSQLACFGSLIEGFYIYSGTAAANNGVFVIYSNSAQQSVIVSRMTVAGGNRGCIKFEIGYGGAAFVGIQNLEAGNNNASTTCISINYGTTVVKLKDSIIETSSNAGSAISLLGGQITIDGIHSEGYATVVNINMTTATFAATLMHATGGNGCTQLVTLQGTNSPGNFALYDATKNGCSTNLVTNGQGGGSNRSTDARPKDGWVSFNP